MYQDIEKKLNAITNPLRKELLNAGVIDANDKIKKPQTFIDVITHKENEINKLFALVEKDGSIVDRNGANLIYSRLSILSDMKEKMSMTPHVVVFEKNSDVVEKKPNKTSKLKLAMRKLFGKQPAVPKKSKER